MERARSRRRVSGEIGRKGSGAEELETKETETRRRKSRAPPS